MSKRVVDCGNCAADHGAIRALIARHFDAQVVQTHGLDDTLEALRAAPADLLLVNRRLDVDASDGLEVIRRVKDQPELAGVPVMLVTNFPEYQQQAVAAGAVPGFGKAALEAPETLAALRRFLA